MSTARICSPNRRRFSGPGADAFSIIAWTRGISRRLTSSTQNELKVFREPLENILIQLRKRSTGSMPCSASTLTLFCCVDRQEWRFIIAGMKPMPGSSNIGASGWAASGRRKPKEPTALAPASPSSGRCWCTATNIFGPGIRGSVAAGAPVFDQPRRTGWPCWTSLGWRPEKDARLTAFGSRYGHGRRASHRRTLVSGNISATPGPSLRCPPTTNPHCFWL